VFIKLTEETLERVLTLLYYLEGGFQLGRCSREQKLNNNAVWNNIPQCWTIGHMFACLEEQWSRR
jgi:hypothetical protein